MSESNVWFKSWFDTPYYHILYQDRDDREARLFIRNLLERLKPPSDAHILDLACGRGRHAKYLHECGCEVTGIDLSPSNIRYARKHYQDERLHFQVGDMRKPYGENRFDYIFNLFTSFGYFNSFEDDLNSLKMMKKALKPGGLLVLDFMNVNKVKLGLVEEEVRKVDSIEFHIERFIRDGMVIKHIRFEADGKLHEYEEEVQLLDRSDFEDLFSKAGLHISNIYGDFHLNGFDPDHSERLILFAE